MVRTDLYGCIFGHYLYRVWVALGRKINRGAFWIGYLPRQTLLNIFSEHRRLMRLNYLPLYKSVKGPVTRILHFRFFMNHLSYYRYVISFSLENYHSKCLFQLKTFLFRGFTPLGSIYSTYKLIFTNVQCMLGVHKLILYGNCWQHMTVTTSVYSTFIDDQFRSWKKCQWHSWHSEPWVANIFANFLKELKMVLMRQLSAQTRWLMQNTEGWGLECPIFSK